MHHEYLNHLLSTFSIIFIVKNPKRRETVIEHIDILRHRSNVRNLERSFISSFTKKRALLVLFFQLRIKLEEYIVKQFIDNVKLHGWIAPLCFKVSIYTLKNQTELDNIWVQTFSDLQKYASSVQEVSRYTKMNGDNYETQN